MYKTGAGLLPTVADVAPHVGLNSIALDWWRFCATVSRPLMNNLVAAKEEGLIGSLMALRRKLLTHRAAPSHTNIAGYRVPLYPMASALDALSAARTSYSHRGDRHTTIVRSSPILSRCSLLQPHDTHQGRPRTTHSEAHHIRDEKSRQSPKPITSSLLRML